MERKLEKVGEKTETLGAWEGETRIEISEKEMLIFGSGQKNSFPEQISWSFQKKLESLERSFLKKLRTALKVADNIPRI